MNVFRTMLLLTGFVLLSVQAGDKNTEILPWQAERPLTWSDFSGTVDPESPYDAWTYSGFNYTYTWASDGSQVDVVTTAYAFFDPAQSWVKVSEQTPELLAHEQVHFDISELYMRRFLKAVSSFSFTERVDAEVDSIYQSWMQALLAAQIEYDEATEHHQNREAQARWSKRIASELRNN